MGPSHLKSNEDLCNYLAVLSDELKWKGKSELADRVAIAGQFAFGSPSEFLHEALIALQSVQATCSDALTGPELVDLQRVIEQIKAAFRRIGGA